jgi:DNA-binding FrmR family transcriptional regulator
MTMGPQRAGRAAGAAGATSATETPSPGAPGAAGSTPVGAAASAAGAAASAAAHAHDADFRHSYSRDRAQLLRRLSRIEGQVRGIGRMIEREEYCVDILQQTAALRAAVDALSIVVLEDHVAGCVRTAAERGQADAYVDEVIDVVRRTLGRPVRSSGRST